jgi:hypothetical protein
MTAEAHADPARRRLKDRVESVGGVPALVRDRHLTVIASNPLARALSPGFTEGVNLARFTFIDSAGYEGAECWGAATAEVAAMLRASLDQHADDTPFRTVVGELSATSAPFSEQWAAEAAPSRRGVARFLDTMVGDLTLVYSEEWIDDAQDEALLVLRPADSEAEGRLEELAVLVDSAPDRPAAR